MKLDEEVVATICKHLSLEDVNQWIWFSSIFTGILFSIAFAIGTVPFWNGFHMGMVDWGAVLLVSAFFIAMALRMLNLCRCHLSARNELLARRKRLDVFIGWRFKDLAKIPVITGGKFG